VADLDTALERALNLVQEGKTPEEALERYPQYRKALEPLLTAALALRAAPLPGLAPAAKARRRAELEAQLAARPRGAAIRRSWLRLAGGLAGICLCLATATTALAQSSLPGEALHPVKLYSEQVWRAVSSNHIQADLLIAQRRLEELLAVEGDAERVPGALGAYASSLDVLRRDLETLPDRALSAQTVLHAQREQMQTVLEATGSTVEEFFTILPTVENLITNHPVQVPLSTPSGATIELVSPVVPVAPSVSVSVSSAPTGEQPVTLSIDVASKGHGLSTTIDSTLSGIKDLISTLSSDK